MVVRVRVREGVIVKERHGHFSVLEEEFCILIVSVCVIMFHRIKP